jgi:hypothetical protein
MSHKQDSIILDGLDVSDAMGWVLDGVLSASGRQWRGHLEEYLGSERSMPRGTMAECVQCTEQWRWA